ncbi:MerR family transcriptional regulator [Kitasatospora sp. NPDC049285]|uniref:MerR family transcriptional regulator n=1 Tax=Kitasatospora sp. NPDC049285 TaxID=3157096 RepID=UPI003437B060
MPRQTSPRPPTATSPASATPSTSTPSTSTPSTSTPPASPASTSPASSAAAPPTTPTSTPSDSPASTVPASPTPSSTPTPAGHRTPPAVTTGEVARRLGVAPATIRSWERRYGIGPAAREPGRHRRWSAADVAVLEAMCALTARGVPPGEAARVVADRGDRPSVTTAAPTAPGGGSTLPVGRVRPECRGLARAAVRLDAAEVSAILRRVLAELGTVTAWTEVVVPALRATGRKWATEGERYVEVEHLLSWHVSTALRVVADRQPPPAAGPCALLAGAPGELHTLPLDALAAALAERGLPVRMFGPAVPPLALLDAVERTGPAAVALWSQTRTTADRTLAHRITATTWGNRGSRTHPRLLPLGPGWPPPTLTTTATPRPRTLAAALDHLQHLLAD